MLVEGQLVEVSISRRNITHYKELGYDVKNKDTIVVPPEHLPTGSNIKVDVICDGCGQLLHREYTVYLNNNNIIEQFTQIGLYSGEVKSLFEEIKKIAEHETTFNVKITEEELKQKNEVALPYIKTTEEKRKDLIEVDQDDIDELYEEDPDEDLDI